MAKRPHVIVLMTDQHRFDTLGAYGDRQCETPNLDALANECVVFDRHYTSCPLCVPARTSLATGRWASRIGVIVNYWIPEEAKYGTLRPEHKTLYERFAEEGYRVAQIGVQHVNCEPPLPKRVPGGLFSERHEYKQYLAERGLVEPSDKPFRAPCPDFIDDEVGRLLATLEELGLSDNTIVAFVSDHGDLMGDHGLYFKGLFFRESWHIPFIVKAPGMLAGRGAVERFASLQDLMPTLLSLCGLPIPQGVHGQDLTGDLQGGPDIVFGSYEPHPLALHCARTARWQYVFHEAGGFEELYDVQRDADERHNLAGLEETREVVRDLRRRTAEWLGQLGDREALDAGGDLKVGAAPEMVDPPMTKLPLGLRPY